MFACYTRKEADRTLNETTCFLLLFFQIKIPLLLGEKLYFEHTRMRFNAIHHQFCTHCLLTFCSVMQFSYSTLYSLSRVFVLWSFSIVQTDNNNNIIHWINFKFTDDVWNFKAETYFNFFWININYFTNYGTVEIYCHDMQYSLSKFWKKNTLHFKKIKNIANTTTFIQTQWYFYAWKMATKQNELEWRKKSEKNSEGQRFDTDVFKFSTVDLSILLLCTRKRLWTYDNIQNLYKYIILFLFFSHLYAQHYEWCAAKTNQWNKMF